MIKPEKYVATLHDHRPPTRMVKIRIERSTRLLRVTKAICNGKTIAEIAESEGVNPSSISRFLRMSGVHVPGIGPGNFSLLIKARRVHIPALDWLAAKWKCERGEVASRLLISALKNIESQHRKSDRGVRHG